ncbi:hypothetical protein LINGRAHAP2_LOCUS7540 [Linum grandiflorum]
MYRELGVASRVESKSIGGCLTLLQSWIYEYFECFRPLIGHPDPRDDGSPLAGRWDGATNVEILSLIFIHV